MALETIRTIILATGWPILIAGSIYILTKAWLFYEESKGSLFGRLVFPSILGWIITMYSLGIVATFYMFDHPRGVMVVLPIFLIWFITFITILAITLRWSKEAAAFQKAHLLLEIQLNEKTAALETTKKREEELINQARKTEQAITETAKKVASPLNAIIWSIDSVLAEKNVSLSKEAATMLENAQKRAEELKAICSSITKPRA